MNRPTKQTNSRESIPTLSPADSGLTFSTLAVLSLAISILFTFAISAIASAKGMDTTTYVDGIKTSFVYVALSFGLSSVYVCLTVLAVSRYKKIRPFSSVVRYTPVRPKYWIIALALCAGLLFSLTSLNQFFIEWLKGFGYSKEDMVLPTAQLWQYPCWIILACVLPAFLEEVVFRGYMLEGLKGFPTWVIVLTSAFTFTIFHQNPQQTPYQFVCGAVFALLAIKSGSVLPGVVMHFINNAVIITFNFFSIQMGEVLTVVLAVVGGVLLIAALVYLIFLDKNKAEKSENPVKQSLLPFWGMASVGLVLCLIMWFSDIILYTTGA